MERTTFTKIVTFAFFSLVLFSSVYAIGFQENMVAQSITGYFSVLDLAPDTFEANPQEGIPTREQAQEGINIAKENIEDLKKLELGTKLLDDILFEAEVAYFQDQNYNQVLYLTDYAQYVKDETIRINDLILLKEQKAATVKEDGFDTTQVEETIAFARTSLFEGRLQEANDAITTIETQIQEATKEGNRLLNLTQASKTFIDKNKYYILVLIVLLLLFGPPIYKKVKRRMLKKKIENLELEMLKTKQMLKRLQKICFIDKKISVDSFKSKSTKYEQRIDEIKHTLPVLTERLTGKKAKKTKRRATLEIKK
jgi:hypothetical protein